jgi:pimeloyl-ACP methyl ester carboxylesterase
VTAPTSRGATSTTFTTRSGLQLAADVWPDGAAPSVVLIHGGGQTRHSWGGTGAALAASGRRVVAYDQRGHGDSGRPADRDYAHVLFADDCVDVCATLTGRDGVAPVVVGASLGGLAALMAEGSIAHDSASALGLVDITPRMEPAGVDRIVGFMLDRIDDGFGTLDEAADAIADYQPHRPRPTDLRGLEKNLRLGDDGRWRWHWDPDLFRGPHPLGARKAAHTFEEAASRLRIPTLLVRGRQSDLVSEETAREFLALCPDAEFVDVSGAGHMVAGDRNDVFTAAVVDFVDRLPTQATSG